MRRKAEDDAETKRCVFPFCEIKKERSDAFPQGVAVLLGGSHFQFLIVKVFRVEASVDVKGCKGGDGSFTEEKSIEGFQEQQFFCEVPDVLYLI